jgi:hypothetical protein
MWIDTPATRLLKIRYPIIQGPFGGGASSVELGARGARILWRPASDPGRNHRSCGAVAQTNGRTVCRESLDRQRRRWHGDLRQRLLPVMSSI